MIKFENTRRTEYVTFAKKCAALLGIQHCSIDIEFEMESATGSDYGYADGDTNHVDITLFRKIYGDMCSREEVLETIAHELIHARQYLNGELKYDTESNAFIWNGKVFHNHTELGKNAPWEKEAHDYAEKLVEITLNKMKESENV